MPLSLGGVPVLPVLAALCAALLLARLPWEALASGTGALVLLIAGRLLIVVRAPR